MRVGIIDADLLSNGDHRFPNLACLKISGYHKEKQDNVKLLLEWEGIKQYDIVYVSKVFDFSNIPIDLDTYSNIKYGGTSLFYDKAEALPDEIEHHKPDYDLYLPWVNEMISKGRKRKEFESYLDYSIGFCSRGCFRKCSFCVNKKYDKVELHSPVVEFIDESKKYICLLDDNILGYSNWKDVIEQLKETNKPFQFKQGMDIRLINEEKAKLLSSCKYKGHYIFAFDNIEDQELIKRKLYIWKKYCKKTTKLYVLCGFDRENEYDSKFWIQDIIDTFERIKILMEYKCLPYIMRYKEYKGSPYSEIYIELARWCNQPALFTKKSFREFCLVDPKRNSTASRMMSFEKECPNIAEKYFDLKYEEL